MFEAVHATLLGIRELQICCRGSQTPVSVTSPNFAHQMKWNRFVNIKGGRGRNIPCELFNRHMNKLIKDIILNMGSNLTEDALNRAVRSVSSIHAICERFDKESCVP